MFLVFTISWYTLSRLSRSYIDHLAGGVDADPSDLIDALIRIWAQERGWRRQRHPPIDRPEKPIDRPENRTGV
jgi:hypothetical protein